MTPPTATTAYVVRPARVEVTITNLRTDPTLVDRLAVPRTVGGWETISTDELLRELHKSGLSGGVVVRQGKPTVWFSPSARE